MFHEVSASYLDTYTRAMRANLSDKLFFARDLDADVVVDFGCADGSLLKELALVRPDLQLVGYDIDRSMVHRAAAQLSQGKFFYSQREMLHFVRNAYAGKRVALVASSVLHEVYAYDIGSSGAWIFWNLVRDPAFTAFVVRDMCVAEQDKVVASPLEVVSRVRARADEAQLRSFEARWGSIDRQGELQHFLLKSLWKANWVRELDEDYMGVTLNALVSSVYEAGYRLDHLTHEVLPAVKDRVALEFGTYVPAPTHVKLVAYRRT